MEQRNGRIDKKLQQATEVYCYYFVYEQRPEDRILETVIRKTKTIREKLGSLSGVVDDELNELKHGIRRLPRSVSKRGKINPDTLSD